MTKFFIEKSIIIQASPAEVWKVLTTPDLVNTWSREFGDGIHAEADWQLGGELLWKDKEGNTLTRGLIVSWEPGTLLRIAFEDVLSRVSPLLPGVYSETYRLLDDNGNTFLSVYAGKLHLDGRDHHAPLWDKALAKIKELAVH